MPGRPAAAYDEEPEHDHRAHDLREGQRSERASPAEGRAEHPHQLDVAPPMAPRLTMATSRTTPPPTSAPRADSTMVGLRAVSAARPERVCQPGQGDDVGDDPDPQVEDHAQCERPEKREELPPPRSRAEPRRASRAKPIASPTLHARGTGLAISARRRATSWMAIPWKAPRESSEAPDDTPGAALRTECLPGGRSTSHRSGRPARTSTGRSLGARSHARSSTH